ncbi:MAG: DUF309 domain-containing protein [Bacteriovoracaceae bacterium]|jgi:uncharacterized protein|nr:DUF309 domain-containing protein [Bacteriovoracaceae bacterium]
MSENLGFGPEYIDRVRKGVELFNEEKFWECHEALEHHWLEDAHDPVRYVYWAIIQVAACLLHYKNQNTVGANGLLIKAKRKFVKVRELKIGNNYLDKVLSWDKLEKLVMSIPDGSSLDRYHELYEFKFNELPGDKK